MIKIEGFPNTAATCLALVKQTGHVTSHCVKLQHPVRLLWVCGAEKRSDRTYGTRERQSSSEYSCPGPSAPPKPPSNPRRSTPATCSRLRPTPKETQAAEKKELVRGGRWAASEPGEAVAPR